MRNQLYIHSIVYVSDDYVPEEEPPLTREEQMNIDEVFDCSGCGRTVSWSMGAADDMPDHCDDCWNLEHYPAVTTTISSEIVYL